MDRAKEIADLYEVLLQLRDVGLSQSYKFDTQIICTLTMIIVLARLSASILTSTIDSYAKDMHRYAFAMVKAERSMPADIAERLNHIKQLRFNVQLQVLRKIINRRIT